MVTFLLGGHILLLLGLTASVFSIAGHYAGAGMVLKNGTKVIRPIILVAVSYTHLDVYKRQTRPFLNTTGFSVFKGVGKDRC